MTRIRVRDRMYCRKCIYRAANRDGGRFLCEYILQVGHSRGCPPGEGCTQRSTEKDPAGDGTKRVCRSCGAAYEGGKYSHLCPECRKKIQRQNGLRVAEKSKKESALNRDKRLRAGHLNNRRKETSENNYSIAQSSGKSK